MAHRAGGSDGTPATVREGDLVACGRRHTGEGGVVAIRDLDAQEVELVQPDVPDPGISEPLDQCVGEQLLSSLRAHRETRLAGEHGRVGYRRRRGRQADPESIAGELGCWCGCLREHVGDGHRADSWYWDVVAERVARAAHTAYRRSLRPGGRSASRLQPARPIRAWTAGARGPVRGAAAAHTYIGTRSLSWQAGYRAGGPQARAGVGS
jgi:hypothetical protein